MVPGWLWERDVGVVQGRLTLPRLPGLLLDQTGFILCLFCHRRCVFCVCLPLCHSSRRSVRQGGLFVTPSVAHVVPVADPQQAVADEQSLCQCYPAPAPLEFFPVPTARSKALVLKFEQQNPPEDLLRHILLDALSAALIQ